MHLYSPCQTWLNLKTYTVLHKHYKAIQGHMTTWCEMWCGENLALILNTTEKFDTNSEIVAQQA